MSLRPILALDHVLAEYRDYRHFEFRAKDPNVRKALRPSSGSSQAGNPGTTQGTNQAAPVRRLRSDTYELLKLLLEERGVITSGDAQDLTKLDAAEVRPYLEKLVEDGLALIDAAVRNIGGYPIRGVHGTITNVSLSVSEVQALL